MMHRSIDKAYSLTSKFPESEHWPMTSENPSPSSGIRDLFTWASFHLSLTFLNITLLYHSSYKIKKCWNTMEFRNISQSPVSAWKNLDIIHSDKCKYEQHNSLMFHAVVSRIITYVDRKEEARTPSFPSFLPSPFMTCCTILPTSFGGKGSHLRRWLVAQPLHHTVS